MDKRILILKQLTGDISIVERNQLKEWLEGNPEHVNIRNQIRTDWRLAKEAKEPFVLESIDPLKTIQQEIAKIKKITAEAKKKPQQKVVKKEPLNVSFLPWLIGIAILLVGFFVIKKIPNTSAVPKMEKRLATMLGEVRSHTLPNQSKVWLNSKSVLSYIEANSGEDQDIDFQGEGYFEISGMGSHIAVIHLPKMILKIKAAQFNISENQTISSAEILVIKGEVKVYSLKGELIATVSAGESGSYQYKKEKFVAAKKFNPNVISWKSKKLVFDNTPLEEVIADIEHYFHQKILLEKKALKHCLVSANYDQPDVNRMLSNLADKYNMQLAQGIHGDYVLRGGHCNAN